MPVSYAGAQGQYPGLDQVNLQLPSSLAGSGDTVIQCDFRIEANALPDSGAYYDSINELTRCGGFRLDKLAAAGGVDNVR